MTSGRTKPTVILKHVAEDLKSIEVVEAYHTWSIFYKGRPIQIKTIANVEFDYPGPKYIRVNFQNRAHALRLRDKMNALFKSTDFTVVRMDSGREEKWS
jgi:hypothetical protein